MAAQAPRGPRITIVARTPKSECVVEMRGLEPLTPAMRTRCSPS